MELNEDLIQRIEKHLDAIDDGLRVDGVSRAERQQICDDVDAQIRDALNTRAGATPSMADLEALLREMDPPEAYLDVAVGASPVTTEAPSATTSPQCSKTAIFGALMIVVGLALLVPMFYATAPQPVPQASFNEPLGQSDNDQARIIVVLVLGLLIPLIGTLLGLVAISQIRHSRGRLYGLPLAYFDATFLPTLLANAVVLGGVAMLIDESARSGGMAETDAPIFMLIASALMLGLTVFVHRKLWRSVKDPLI